MSRQQQCVRCNKRDAILTCNGCQQTFCREHVIEHRQELAHELDGIMQGHDLLQRELTRSSEQHILMEKINKWEQKSITKIQLAAKTARTDLQQITKNSKERLTKECRGIAEILRSYREADDFSELDLTRWMRQLEELKLETSSPSSVQIIEDEHSVIPLITIHDYDSKKKVVRTNESTIFLNHILTSSTQEKFSKVIGPGKIHEGLLAICTGGGLRFAYFLGQQLYFQDRQTVLFKIEQSRALYDIFFGCISSQIIEKEIHYKSPFAIGWFGLNTTYQHGFVKGYSQDQGYNSGEIKMNDIIQLTFDCRERQIVLFQERRNIRHTLAVDINKAPLPWQLLLILTRIDDRVRILS